MFNTIKKLLGFEYEIDSKIFCKALVQYPYNSDSSGAYLSHITAVWATWKGNRITVHIKTHCPGILIGKAGRQISEIKELMEYMSKNKDLSIDIQEETMFNGLYY